MEHLGSRTALDVSGGDRAGKGRGNAKPQSDCVCFQENRNREEYRDYTILAQRKEDLYQGDVLLSGLLYFGNDGGKISAGFAECESGGL